MIHLKLFEEVFKYQPIPQPEVGDWIFAYDIDITNDIIDSEKMNEYMRTHIGQAITPKRNQVSQGYLLIKYTNIPDDVFECFKKSASIEQPVVICEKSATMNILYEEITYWSNNREELQEKMELVLALNKYNM